MNGGGEGSREVGPISVVVPACNEAAAIGLTLEQVQAAIAEAGLEGEIIVVDDGSTDGTADEVARHPAVHLKTQVDPETPGGLFTVRRIRRNEPVRVKGPFLRNQRE